MPWMHCAGQTTSRDFLSYGLFSPKTTVKLSQAEQEALVAIVNQHPYSYAGTSDNAAVLYQRKSDGYEVVAITSTLAAQIGFSDPASAEIDHFWIVEFDETDL